MALFRLSISLPDRPGALGLLASAIGAAGGDIRGLVVLKSEDGRGYDDITVAVPGSDPTDLLNVLGAIGGVEALTNHLESNDLQKKFHMSDRQLSIAKMIADGLTNREIAKTLNFSESTARYETIKIYERLQVKNRAQAAAMVRSLISHLNS